MRSERWEPHGLFDSAREAERFLDTIVRGETPTMPNSVDPSATIPADKFERTAEAIRHVLPELVKLDRYESRAVARRDRAIRQIVKNRSTGDRDRVNHAGKCLESSSEFLVFFDQGSRLDQRLSGQRRAP